jgi:hypothetical protein
MAVEEYMFDASLMRKAVGMMDNVVSADEEFADIVLEKGGRSLVAAVQALHRPGAPNGQGSAEGEEGDAEVADACESCLLSMDAMAKQKEQAQASKTGRAALFARLGADAVNLGNGPLSVGRAGRTGTISTGSDAEPEPSEDPLRECRALLAKGVALKGWAKGVPSDQNLYVPLEFNSVIVRDTAGVRSKAGVRIPLRNIDKVVAGKGEGHVKKGAVFGGGSKDNLEQCLVLLDKPKAGTFGGGKELACLSFTTEAECALWTEALARLLQTSRCWPHRLKAPTPGI